MAEERELSYESMVERALRGVVREALESVAEQGLPGNHHFYITFHSHYHGVQLPAYLIERYPNEMTIVLQHQFWNLEVREDGFSVSLSFDNKPEQLVIPFAAIVSFADPSVEFVLQFEPLAKQGEAEIETLAPPKEEAPSQAEEPEAEEADKSAQVVTLDSFRRK